MFRIILFVALFFSSNVFAQEKTSEKANKKKLTIITGSSTGTYFIFANDIKKALTNLMDIDIKESTGSIDNIRRISTFDNNALAVVQSDVFGFLMRSKENESKGLASKLSMIFPLYVEEVHILTKKDIKSIDDLKKNGTLESDV